MLNKKRDMFVNHVGKLNMNEKILESIDIEAKRIAKWLEKQEEDFRDYFVTSFLVNSNLGYFETLGLLEHVKSEMIRVTNMEGKEDE